MRIDSGRFRLRADYIDRSKLWCFVPTDLFSVVDALRMDDEVASLLIQAHRALGVLEGVARYIPRMDCYEDMLICNEACKSCAIDNISVSLFDLLTKTVNSEGNHIAINYFDATKGAAAQPFSSTNLCNLHGTILNGVADDCAGRLRTRPFVMHPFYHIDREEFNPPPPDELGELLGDLERFACADEKTDILVKAALIYYQFETIHPFERRNGLVGRLLSTLLLKQDKILSRPILSLSNYLYEFHDECLRCFWNIQYFGEYMRWIKFFLQGLIVSATQTTTQIESANQLRKENLSKLTKVEKPTKVLFDILDYIEQYPVVNITELADALKISYNTATKYVRIMEELKIVHQINDQSRYRLFAYGEYLKIFSGTSYSGDE